MRLNLQLDRALALAMMQARLDECERYVATRSLIEALRKEAHFEIEQVVRTPGELSRRVRSGVQLVHNADGSVVGGRLNVERDGEAILEWNLPLGDDPYLVLSDPSIDNSVFVVTNSALTAITLHATVIERLIGGVEVSSDVRSGCEHIASNVRRAWQALSASSENSLWAKNSVNDE